MNITKKLKNRFAVKAAELEKAFNPYKAKATKYNISGEQRYLYGDKSYTEDEIAKAYIDTAAKEIESGYTERMVGYYDKWHRYRMADEGTAYDAGARMAADDPKCPHDFQIIEFNTYA